MDEYTAQLEKGKKKKKGSKFSRRIKEATVVKG